MLLPRTTHSKRRSNLYSASRRSKNDFGAGLSAEFSTNATTKLIQRLSFSVSVVPECARNSIVFFEPVRRLSF